MFAIVGFLVGSVASLPQLIASVKAHGPVPASAAMFLLLAFSALALLVHAIINSDQSLEFVYASGVVGNLVQAYLIRRKR